MLGVWIKRDKWFLYREVGRGDSKVRGVAERTQDGDGASEQQYKEQG